MKFRVNVREVHIQGYAVEAENKAEAKRIVEEGGGALDEGFFEYSHTLDSDLWTVDKLEGKDSSVECGKLKVIVFCCEDCGETEVPEDGALCHNCKEKKRRR